MIEAGKYDTFERNCTQAEQPRLNIEVSFSHLSLWPFSSFYDSRSTTVPRATDVKARIKYLRFISRCIHDRNAVSRFIHQ